MQPKIFKSKGLQNRSQQEQPTSTTSPLITQFNFPPHNQKQYPFSLFPVGSEVEVSSDEEGFRDAWYLATVIPPPSSSTSSSSLVLSSKQQPPQLFVEYKNLFADENGYALLKEFVDVGFVRPKPPVDEEDEVLFEVNDVVDAFFQDGWWTGVVTKVIEKDRDYLYKVFFSNPPEELKFRSSDLRVRRNWIDGKWVRPEKERMREVKFSPGTDVEVNIDLDTSPDVWYPATVIKQVDNSFVVEYQSSKEAGHQRVAVDFLHIRPSPPSSSKKGFSLLEKVDAFYDFRWLSGVVTKLLSDGRYIVYFKRTKKEKELYHADLRLHMEWSNGKWVHSSRDTSVTSIPEKQLECAVNGGYKEKLCAPATQAREERNNVVTLNSCQSLLHTPCSEKADNGSTMPHNQRTKQRSANVDSIHWRKRMNEGTSSEAPSYSEIGKLRLKQTDELLSGTSAVLGSSTPGKSGLKQSEVINQSSASMDNETVPVPVPRRRGRPPRQRSIELSGSDQKPNGDGWFTPCEPIVLGLTHNGKMTESLSMISSLPLKGESGMDKKEEEKKSSNTEGNREFVVSELQKDGEVTNLKRKRGKPPQSFLRLGSPKAKEAGISDANPFSAASRRRRWRVLSDHPRGLRAQNSRTGRQIMRGLKSPKEMLSEEFSEPLALRRGRRQVSTKRVQPPAKNRVRTAKVLNNGVVRDVKTVAGISSNVSDDDKPLSAWFEGAHCPTTDGIGTAGLCDGTGENHEGSKIQLVGQPTNRAQNQGESTAAECVPEDKIQLVGQPKDHAQENQGESTAAECVPQEKDASERQDQAPTNSTAIPVDVYDRELPFVKNSLVWQMIESMEVLKQIPQRPHFRPLYKFKEECREGLAIGNMVTFTSLVDRISGLQFSDPKNVLDGYLDALNDLEDLGFNVLPVRGRLRALVSFKERYEHAQNTVIDIETQIMEHDHEKSKIDDEIAELNKKIAEINEKQALAVSKKELKDAEVRLLQSSVDAVKGSLVKAKDEFDKIATSDCKKRKNEDRGKERENGTYSVDRNGITSNGEAVDAGKRRRNGSSKPLTPAKNGNGREVRKVSYNSGNKVATLRKRQKIGSKNVSNGTSNKLRVKRNGNLKEPRRRASNHAGQQQCEK